MSMLAYAFFSIIAVPRFAYHMPASIPGRESNKRTSFCQRGIHRPGAPMHTSLT